MNKTETKVYESIRGLRIFPSFLVYVTDPPTLMALNDSHNFCRIFMRNLLYYPHTPLENMIMDSAHYSFWGKYEYEHWIDNLKFPENSYMEQFVRWWDVNKKEFLENPDLVKLYNKITKKRLKLKSYSG